MIFTTNFVLHLHVLVSLKMERNQCLPLGMVEGRLKSEINRVLKKRFEEQTEIKLTIEEYIILQLLNRESDEVIQKSVAERLGKDKSAIMRLIVSLEEKELIIRVCCKEDRRKNQLIVTKSGKKIIEQYQKIESELIEKLEKGISTTDLEIFYRVIDKIRNNAEVCN